MSKAKQQNQRIKDLSALLVLTSAMCLLPPQIPHAENLRSSSGSASLNRDSISIQAKAVFKQVSKIEVKYNIQTNAVTSTETGNENIQPFAQVHVMLSQMSDPVVMSCDMQTAIAGERPADAPDLAVSPCVDIASMHPQQLLTGGQSYTRRVALQPQGDIANELNNTVIINFSYL